jgi:simple sugar transport system ATP-binding protein
MDEPTTTLTQKEVESLFNVIKGLQQEGISTLFVSHKLREVLEISEKVTILRNGEKVADGDIENFDRAKLVYYMTGREIDESRYRYEGRGEKLQSLLKVEDLGRKGSFEEINFEIFPGEIVGITGLLGSGRTKLALALFGLKSADSGKIYVGGKLTEIKNVRDAIRQGIGYVPEDRLVEGLCLEQSIGRNIIISIIERLSGMLGVINFTKMKGQIEKSIDYLRIKTPSSYLPVQSLSGGNQQRVVLAKWLATQGKILILNGPTVGVDIGSKMDIHKTLRELAKQGMGIIIISDDIPELLQNCNRIVLMHKGRITDELLGEGCNEDELTERLNALVK